MKKFLAIAIASILLVLGMVVTANAAEYVYYENDFSNPDTLADFTQYRGEWSVVDGQLMLAGIGDLGMDQFCYLLYTKDEGIMNLTDYIVEVDLLNTQSSAGVLFRCDTTKASGDSSNSFYGYLAFLSNSGTKGAFGRADGLGGWAGNMNVSADVNTPGSNLHMKVTAAGKNITYVLSDLATGTELYTYSVENGEWAMGSFGLRAAIMQSGMTNLGLLGFDNLKVVATGEVGDWLASGKALKDYKPGVSSELLIPKITEAIEVTVPEVVQVEASKLDASKTEYVFYQNDFSDPATIADFTQYRGDWTIKDGALYYTAVTTGFEATSNFSFILYSGNHDANLLQNYTVEFDVLNSQTAVGLLSHCDLAQADSTNGNTFYGYCSFIGNNGTIGATGYTAWDGSWGGNLKVGEAVLNPGSNYHLKVQHLDGTFHYTISAVGSDEVIWEDTQIDADWPAGSFGVRMRVALDNLVCLDTTGIDNFKVTVHGKEAVLLNAGYHPNAEIVGTLPVETTVAPVETTAAPVETTLAPVETTAAPVETTAAPVETTAAPVETTAAPVETTAAPVETTAAPVETTAAPVETTAAPIETTVAPVETTAAPVETTAAPVQTTAPTTATAADGASAGMIIGIIAVVVVVALVVVVVLKKKKN